ncbi:MAG: DUF2793 domain-containing protein [Parvularculaceae bacterium]
MQTSPRLGLTYILPQQAQKHVAANETFRRLDALVQPSVSARILSAEPAAPLEGAAYILPAGASGANWSLMAPGSVAVFQDGAWTHLVPLPGWRVFVETEGAFVYFDGAHWRGETASIGGAAGENLLINAGYTVNQRGFAGGALAAGAYGFDRWRAGAGGASVSRSGGAVTLASGVLEQVIEPSVFGRDSFAGLDLAASAIGLVSGSLVVSAAGVSVTLTPAAPSARLTIPGSATAELLLALAAPSGAAVFKAIKLEEGTEASAYAPRLGPVELALCRRYYAKSVAAAVAPADGASANTQWGGAVAASNNGAASGNIYFPETMRAAPAIQFQRLSLGTQNGRWNYVKAGVWKDDLTATMAVGVTDTQFRVRIEATATNPFTEHYSYALGGDWTANAEY